MRIHDRVPFINGKAVFVAGVLLLASLTSFALAEHEGQCDITSVSYAFDAPVVEKVIIGTTTYDQPMMDDAPCFGNPGEPGLPVKSAYIMLPQKARVTDIQVTLGDMIYVGSGYTVAPVGEPYPLSQIERAQLPIPDATIYRSQDMFPGKLFTEVGTYSFRGYDMLVLMLHPVQYKPNSGELYYYPDMTVAVETASDGQINPLFRGLEKDKQEIMTRVDNPAVATTYTEIPASRPTADDTYDLLIITTDSLKSGFEPLKAAHDSDGIQTEIKTLTDIGLGSITPINIRDYVRDAYVNNGISYVLIGGDDDVVPAQQIWVNAGGGTEDNMPSDLFYGCLDGPYNYDGDDKWGELTDGTDGKDVDLVAEVYVGRACVGSSDEVQHFIDKTVAYMESGSHLGNNVLMIGEFLWPNPDTWGGDYMDELINGSNTHGYVTAGIPASQYAISTLYDRDWPGHDWPKEELINRINNGAYMIHHLGHAYYGYDLKMVNNDVLNLTNDEYSFIYSQGCMAGGFDNPDGYDCIAEYFTIKTEHGAFAGVLNARYGWGVIGSTNGASQRYHRRFVDATFGQNISEIGKANQDSKEDNIAYAKQGVMRWCYFETNLFGDPTLKFDCALQNTPPQKPQKPEGTTNGDIKTDYDFTTQATDADTDKLYYKWSWGDGTFSAWLGPYDSGQSVTTKHSWNTTGTYEVKVMARDVHRATSDWSDPLPVKMPYEGSEHPWLALLLKIVQERFPRLYTILLHLLEGV